MKIHDKLPNFNLPGTDNKYHSPKEYEDKKAILIIFTCNHCPYALAYIKRISSIEEKYADNVGIFAINPNDAVNYPADAFENMPLMAKKLNLEGKYLHDETQEIAGRFAAKKTPEVFLFDKDRTLVYCGAIDDNHENPELVSNKYLEDAIEKVLNNKSVSETETSPIGCSIKWKQ